MKIAHFALLPQAIHHICRNWTYFNLPYVLGSVRLDGTPSTAALAELQLKQQYLRSLDTPDPDEVHIREPEAAEYAKDHEGSGPRLAQP